MHDLVSRIQATLYGVAIGDAMGMPWEMMTHTEILEATKGSGVSGFSDPVQRKLKGTMNLKAGDTTDDWQLTAANIRSLVRSGEYNHVDCATEHVNELMKTRFGWGKTTKNSIQKIARLLYGSVLEGKKRDDVKIPEAEPILSGKPGAGCGNGVAMKIAPIALFYYLRDGIDPNSLWEVVRLHGSLTHPDIRATIAAYALALTLQIAIDPKHRSQKYILKFLQQECRRIEDFYPTFDLNVSDVFGKIIKDDLRLIDTPDQLREVVGTSCFSLESVPFAIATFLRHPSDFRAGVLEAINAGGDTDSAGSMVGALIGANCGLDVIPIEWKDFRPEYTQALGLGEALFRVAKG